MTVSSNSLLIGCENLIIHVLRNERFNSYRPQAKFEESCKDADTCLHDNQFTEYLSCRNIIMGQG